MLEKKRIFFEKSVNERGRGDCRTERNRNKRRGMGEVMVSNGQEEGDFKRV